MEDRDETGPGRLPMIEHRKVFVLQMTDSCERC